MPFDLFYIVAALMTLLILVLWLALYMPVQKMMTALRRSRESLLKEWKIQGNYTFFLSEGYKMFSNKSLMAQWELYRASINRNKGQYEYTNICEYFSPDDMLEETTNTTVARFAPVVVFLLGFILTAVATTVYGFNNLLTEDILLEAAILVLASALAALTMAIYYKQITYKTREQLRLFSRWISQGHNAIPSLSEEIADIRRSMQTYQQEQLKFYAKLSDHIAQTTKKAVRPYMESTKDVIEKFVQAATKRQVESMKHLAEYFANDTTRLYLEQIQKIHGTTVDMAEIQSRTAATLESVTTIYTESKDLIRQVGDTTNNALARYDNYMIHIEEMQGAVTATVKELRELVEYIRANAKNQNFTIEHISQFQKELIDTSARSTEAMQSFFADFKDQYSSSIIALRAASQDMMKAGEFLKGAYTGLADDVNSDVTQVFKTFEENLATISMHLSRSITDLQEAIDELPEILKRIDTGDQH
ncbi:MAG: hypothetical protein ACYC5K_05975 [Saccharofermentanales bacterium]